MIEQDDPKTLVMTRKAGEKIIFKIDDHLILDLLVVEVSGKRAVLSMRTSDRIKISTIRDLIIKKNEVQ